MAQGQFHRRPQTPATPACPHRPACALKPLTRGQEEEVGEEMGSTPWPQSLGVACLLPAGKREFGEISAADVPDNTARGGVHGACACLTRMCSPSSNPERPGSPQACWEFARAWGVPESMSRTPASLQPGIRGRQAGRGSHTPMHPHTHVPWPTDKLLCTLQYPAQASLHSPPRLPRSWPPQAPLGHLLLNLLFTKQKGARPTSLAQRWVQRRVQRRVLGYVMTQINSFHFQGNSQPGFHVSFEIISAQIRILFESGTPGPPGAGRECDLGSDMAGSPPGSLGWLDGDGNE